MDGAGLTVLTLEMLTLLLVVMLPDNFAMFLYLSQTAREELFPVGRVLFPAWRLCIQSSPDTLLTLIGPPLLASDWLTDPILLPDWLESLLIVRDEVDWSVCSDWSSSL